MPVLKTPLGDYVCAAVPDLDDGASLEAALAALAGRSDAPALLHWDGRTASGERVRWGVDGLDPVLAGDRDLSACAAVSDSVMSRLIGPEAPRTAVELARAVALLLRGGGARSAPIGEVTGKLGDGAASGPAGGAPATAADRISVALTVREDSRDIGPFLTALSAQALTARTELLLVTQGLSTPALQAVTRQAETWAASTSLRLRRYAFDDEVPANYLSNAVVALATGESVVFADPRTLPGGAALLQTLADWAASAGVAAACPRFEHDGVLLAAGLALDDQGRLGPHREAGFADALRLAAAPSPWLFAANRRLWLESGGLPAAAEPALWTSGFAAAGGPAGRVLYVGGQTAIWSDRSPPEGASASAPIGRPQAHAGRAMRRVGDGAESGSVASRPADAPPQARTPVTALADLPLPKRAAAPTPSPLSDSPAPGALRVLVFADAYGASQSIIFEHGLAQARAAGRVAIRLLEEDAFGGDGGALTQAPVHEPVEAEFEWTRPDLVVVSRLGRASLWTAVRRAADRRRLPILFHLDDDLFDLPLSAGIERYRAARAPRRLATLQACLEGADLTLAATPGLAERLRGYAGHDRVLALQAGAAGTPGGRRAARGGGRVRIGYMGSASHDADLALIAPALNAVADRMPEVDFELFGSIARQPAAELLTRVKARHPGVEGDYAAFKARLAALDWDIGLAPLRSIAFNRLKTPTKWAEYAEAGAAVLASAIEPYEGPAAAGAALTVPDDGWAWALQRLAADAGLRRSLTRAADKLLTSRYSWTTLGLEVEAALVRAAALSRTPAPAKLPA